MKSPPMIKLDTGTGLRLTLDEDKAEGIYGAPRREEEIEGDNAEGSN